VSLFEPDQPDQPCSWAWSVAGEQPVAPVQAPPRTRRAWLLVVLAVAVAVGIGLGFAVGSRRSGGEPASATATRPPVTRPASAPVSSVVVRPTVSSACLETATRADELIDLLVKHRRGRAAELLVAYTIASRQCRRDASP
jgi:hypothetical protein